MSTIDFTALRVILHKDFRLHQNINILRTLVGKGVSQVALISAVVRGFMDGRSRP